MVLNTFSEHLPNHFVVIPSYANLFVESERTRTLVTQISFCVRAEHGSGHKTIRSCMNSQQSCWMSSIYTVFGRLCVRFLSMIITDHVMLNICLDPKECFRHAINSLLPSAPCANHVYNCSMFYDLHIFLMEKRKIFIESQCSTYFIIKEKMLNRNAV